MLVRKAAAAIAVLGLLALGLVPAVSAQAASQIFANPPAGSGATFAVPTQVAQAFVIPRDGVLDWVELGLGSAADDLTIVELTRASEMGLPSSGMLATPSTFEQRDGYERYGFTGIRVFQGEVYAITLRYRSGAAPTMRIGADIRPPAAVSAGGLWSWAAHSIAYRFQLSDIAPSISGTPKASITQGFRYDYWYAVDGAPAPTVTATGLPPGFTMGTDGHLSGTPTQAGSWTFDVTAASSAGSQTISSTIQVVEQAPPDPPTITSVTVSGTTATVHWTPPAYTGGHSLTFYNVTVQPGGLTCGVGPTSTSCRVSGLQRTTQYTATVTARAVSLVSEPSAPSEPFTGEFAPLAPRGVVAVAGDGEASVSWSPPTDPGTGPITSYRAVANPGGASCVTDATGSRCTITGLANGDEYTVTVTASNAVGSSPSSSGATVVPFGLPLAPTGVAAEAGDESARVSWSAADAQGSPVTEYRATAEPGGASCTSTGTGCTVTGLDNGTSYTFTVTAENAVGRGAASAPSDAVVPAGRPGAPREVRVVAQDGVLFVLWSPPDDDNGSPLLSYRVEGTAGLGCAVPADGQRVCVFSSVRNGTEYAFTVAATTAAGDSVASLPVAGTPFGRPAAPTAVDAAPGAASALVSWDAADGNGRPVLLSTVTASPGGVRCVSAASSCQLEGLIPGMPYTVTVTSTNAAGVSPSSSPIHVTPVAEPEREPRPAPSPTTGAGGSDAQRPASARAGWDDDPGSRADAHGDAEPGELEAEDERRDADASAESAGDAGSEPRAVAEAAADGGIPAVLLALVAVAGVLIGAAGAVGVGRWTRRPR